MNHSPLLGLDDELEPARPGHGMAALGPSDTSDSGSDVAGADMDGIQQNLDLDTDADGTGERMGASGSPRAQEAADILPDHIEVVPALPVLGEDADGDNASADNPDLRQQARRSLMKQAGADGVEEDDAAASSDA